MLSRPQAIAFSSTRVHIKTRAHGLKSLQSCSRLPHVSNSGNQNQLTSNLFIAFCNLHQSVFVLKTIHILRGHDENYIMYLRFGVGEMGGRVVWVFAQPPSFWRNETKGLCDIKKNTYSASSCSQGQREVLKSGDARHSISMQSGKMYSKFW